MSSGALCPMEQRYYSNPSAQLLAPDEFPRRTFLAVTPRSALANTRFGEVVAGGKALPKSQRRRGHRQ
jgi:hypothetical protein